MRGISLATQIERAVSALRPGGVCTPELMELFNVGQPRVSVIMGHVMQQGRAFATRIGNGLVYFSTEAEMLKAKQARVDIAREKERLRALKRQPSKARQAEAIARAEARALRRAEAEIAKQRARLDREAAAAEKHRQKVEAESQKRALKAMTKAAGKMGKRKGTATANAPAKRGPGHMPGDPVIDENTVQGQPVTYPTNRWVPGDAPKLFSLLKIGQYLEGAVA